MRQSRGVPNGSNSISNSEAWIISIFTRLPLVSLTIDSSYRLAAHHYYPRTVMAPNAEGEQYCGPLSHDGLDDDDFYLDFLQQVTHYPDDYHHGPSATVNALPHVQDIPPLSRVGDAPLSSIVEFPFVEQRLSLGLSHSQDLLEGAFFTEGSSPPPSLRETVCDDRDLFWTMMALGYSPEFPLSAYDQHAFSWDAPQPPLDQSGQVCHLPIPQEAPQSPGADPVLESCRITGLTSEPSLSQNLNIFPCGPISETGYHDAMGADHSGLIQASTTTIQESPVDTSAATIHINERLMYPTTSPQALWGYVDGFPGISTNDHGSTIPYTVHQNEEAASPNFQSALQTGHPAITSLITSSQVTPVDDISGTLWCPICGISFSQRQGLNRHSRDKHAPRNTCHLCGTYEWSPGRRYMFIKHLERHHPEAVLAY
ncbi:hypothetical protein EDB92DRAFT_660417 [Lactarius akahatsu]|uniref:C2H2-type domain-containing protein n=1 Tax=Lactarius akahatsu TaxID=416441 RepID=A0AAD4LGG2_9AGAM|nr:hypothetical protein EDB92DRAFT_660417 [Lactarius akahatsu]